MKKFFRIKKLDFLKIDRSKIFFNWNFTAFSKSISQPFREVLFFIIRLLLPQTFFSACGGHPQGRTGRVPVLPHTYSQNDIFYYKTTFTSKIFPPAVSNPKDVQAKYLLPLLNIIMIIQIPKLFWTLITNKTAKGLLLCPPPLGPKIYFGLLVEKDKVFDVVLKSPK